VPGSLTSFLAGPFARSRWLAGAAATERS